MGTPTTPHLQPLRCILPPPPPPVKGCVGRGPLSGGEREGESARWSVSRVLSPLAGGAAIHLGHRLLGGSSDQPGDPGGAPVPTTRAEASPYLTLLQAEFAAFHPASEPKLSGGLVSVALVRASRRTGVTRCLTPWSPDFPRTHPKVRSRPSDHLAEGESSAPRPPRRAHQSRRAPRQGGAPRAPGSQGHDLGG